MLFFECVCVAPGPKPMFVTRFTAGRIDNPSACQHANVHWLSHVSTLPACTLSKAVLKFSAIVDSPHRSFSRFVSRAAGHCFISTSKFRHARLHVAQPHTWFIAEK